MTRLGCVAFAALVACGCVERGPALSSRDAGTDEGIALPDLPPPPDAAVSPIAGRRTVAAASDHTCALGGDGLYCWGSDADGRLGNGAADDSLTPVRVAGDRRFVSVVALNDHTCALDDAGTVYCWGANEDGQLGLGDREVRDVPTSVPLGERVLDLDAGQAHTCAVTESGRLYCWGRNAEGQLGVMPISTTDSDVPLQVGEETDWTHISTGQGSTCGLRGGALWCWGRNSSNQLGLGPDAPGQRRTPTEVTSEAAHVEVVVGQNHGCALRLDGAIDCWGDNSNFQLGTGDLTGHAEPFTIDAGPWDQVDTDTFHGCAIADGLLACWGRNTEGQLGLTDTSDRPEPTPLPPSPRSAWSEVSTGRFHTCARDEFGDVYCTGSNYAGMLGTADEDRRRELTLVLRVSPG